MESEFVNYCCKTCGRAIRSKQKPIFCYADRTPNLENISDEDSVKMGLFVDYPGYEIGELLFEFPGDIKYHPFTGQEISFKGTEYQTFKKDDIFYLIDPKRNLSSFQEDILKRITNE